MHTWLKLVSLIALVATILPSILFLGGFLEHDAVKLIALIGTTGWFIATPLWMDRKREQK